MPLEWINVDRTDMLPAFLSHARPQIQAGLKPIYSNYKLPFRADFSVKMP